jgi:murein DD-endopeptidase MepM/ murein hydrolase activator NlpD
MGLAIGWIHLGPQPRVIALALMACCAAGCSQEPARFNGDPPQATGTIAALIPPAPIPMGGASDGATGAKPRIVAPQSRPAEISRPYRAAVPQAAGARPKEPPTAAKPPVKLATLPVPKPPAPRSAAPKTLASSPPARSPAEAPAAVEPTQETDAAPSFHWPVRGQVIAGFGPKPDGQRNDGIDIAVPENTPIKAADDGVVIYSGNQLKSFGNLVLVRHSNDYVTAYAYAKEVRVKKGDTIKSGDVIGTSGQTGNAAAPEVHFEIRKGSTPVDPIRLLHGA